MALQNGFDTGASHRCHKDDHAQSEDQTYTKDDENSSHRQIDKHRSIQIGQYSKLECAKQIAQTLKHDLKDTRIKMNSERKMYLETIRYLQEEIKGLKVLVAEDKLSSEGKGATNILNVRRALPTNQQDDDTVKKRMKFPAGYDPLSAMVYSSRDDFRMEAATHDFTSLQNPKDAMELLETMNSEILKTGKRELVQHFHLLRKHLCAILSLDDPSRHESIPSRYLMECGASKRMILNDAEHNYTIGGSIEAETRSNETDATSTESEMTVEGSTEKDMSLEKGVRTRQSRIKLQPFCGFRHDHCCTSSDARDNNEGVETQGLPVRYYLDGSLVLDTSNKDSLVVIERIEI